MGLVIGSDLTDFELRDLERRWITRIYAEAAGLRHVDHFTAKDILGSSRTSGDLTALAIPYYLPEGKYPVTWRIRRENPDIDERTGKPKAKYLAAGGDRNHIYFPVGTTLAECGDTQQTVVITEGELKTIAMRRLAIEGTRTPRFLVIGLSGIWNYIATVGTMENENGVRVPVKGFSPELDLIKWIGRNVIIIFDSDAVVKDDVRKARWKLSVELRQRGANVGWVEWDQNLGKGVDDWLAHSGPDPVLNAISRVDYNTATGWRAKLLCNDSGKPKALFANACTVLEGVPEFAGIALDEFTGQIIRPASLPWKASNGRKVWTDYDSLQFTVWLQHNHIECGKDTADDAVQSVAEANGFHPVRDYLNSLSWDGNSRIDNWLCEYLGVTPSNYSAAAGRCWLISAVARIFQPGCKADVALLFIGPEGRRKSTACRILGAPWFSDNVPDLGEKDAQMHVKGHWILELQELAALNKAALNTIKAWMSRSEDIYRPPYGRHVIHQARQCVFVATTNDYEPLRDTTGNRRFWPVDVNRIDTDALAEAKDQLWAEAVEMYHDGTQWWFTDDRVIAEAEVEQKERVDQHVWYDSILKWCVDREFTTVTEILDGAIGKDKPHRTHADKISVVRCLQQMEWRMVRRRINGQVTRIYLNPEWLDAKKDE